MGAGEANPPECSVQGAPAEETEVVGKREDSRRKGPGAGEPGHGARWLAVPLPLSGPAPALTLTLPGLGRPHLCL